MDTEEKEAARYLEKMADKRDQQIAKLTIERDEFRRMASLIRGRGSENSAVLSRSSGIGTSAKTGNPTPKGGAQAALMKVFDAHPGEALKVGQIMAEMSANGDPTPSEAAVRQTITRLLHNGKIVSVRPGQYQAPDSDHPIVLEWPRAAGGG